MARDEMAHRVVVEYLDTVIDRHQPAMASSIRPLIRQLLPAGDTVAVIAAQFRLHPKALRRRLVAEGSTFNAVVDDVRRELAQRYLRAHRYDVEPLGPRARLRRAERSLAVLSALVRCGPAALRSAWRSTQSVP